MEIGEEETSRNFVSPVFELAIIVRSHLVVVKSPRVAQIERSPGARIGRI